MSHALEWSPLSRATVTRRLKEWGSDSTILAVRRDGKGYFGRVSDVNDSYVELTNGDHVQNLYFVGSPTVFAVIQAPDAPPIRMGERRLKFER